VMQPSAEPAAVPQELADSVTRLLVD
jgi:hypothetical protein